MNPPDRETTRQALTNLYGSGTVQTWPAKVVVEAAAEAWSRIAPDTRGEFPTENLERLFTPLMNFRKWVKETDEITDHDLLVTAKGILVEIVRLAEGGDDGD